MGLKISDLPASAGAAFAMQFEVNNAGTSERLTLAQMFALSTGAVVADTPLLNFAQTWNNGAVAFTALKLGVTDSASDAASRLMDFKVGGTSKFTVTKTGAVTTAGGFLVGCDSGWIEGFDTTANAHARNVTGRVWNMSFFGGQGALTLAGGMYIGFNPNPGGGGVDAANPGLNDVKLLRDAAQTLALRNETNAQEFRLYNTFTDASNYERAAFSFRKASGYLVISTERAGTGAPCALWLVSAGDLYLSGGGAGVGHWRVNSSGHLLANADNSYDIGALGADRPRNLFISGGFLCSYIQTVNQLDLGGASGSNRAILYCPADGVLRLTNGLSTDFNRLTFGGTSASFPSLKRSSDELHVRLADDSDFAKLRGRLSTHAAAVSETITPNSTLLLYDSTGTAYKVPCVAA